MLYWMGKAGQDASLSNGWGFNPSGKYKNPKELASGIKSDLYRIYHSVFGLKYKEKFLFSATLFVWISDMWHLLGTLRHFSLIAIASHHVELVDSIPLNFVLLYSSGLVVFNVFFRLLRFFG